MTTPRQTLPQKLADWQTAYDFVFEALADKYVDPPANGRKLIEPADGRNAAIVAAMLVGQNVRPVIVPEEE